MAQKTDKIVICGHYGSTNIGDEAIGLSIVKMLYNLNPDDEIVVLSYDKEGTKRFYKKYAPEVDVKSNYLLPLGFRSFLRGILKGELWRTLKQIKTCDKFILGGGGLFTDEKLFAVFLWGLHAYFAYKYKKPVYMIGQSIGPLKTRIGKWITAKVFNKAKYINLRDIESKNILKNLGIKNEIIVTCDPVFGLEFNKKFDQNLALKQLNKKVERLGHDGYFIFTIRPWMKEYEKLYTNFIQIINSIALKYNLLPVFVPFQVYRENDRAILNKIIVQSHLRTQIEFRNFSDDINEILSVFSNAKFVIGVRLHSLLFSYLTQTPFVAISYSPKIENFLRMTGFEKYISKHITEKDIFTVLEKVLSNSDDLSLELKEKSKLLNKIWKEGFKLN